MKHVKLFEQFLNEANELKVMKNLIEEFKAIKKELITRKVLGEITTKQYNKLFQTSLQIYADKANMSKGAFGFETIK